MVHCSRSTFNSTARSNEVLNLEEEEEEEEIYFSKQFTVIQLVTNQYIDIYYHRHT